jgi:uncharacterized protein YndB with AHSA1/START domain
MSYVGREIEVTVPQAFAALVDPRTYPAWLVGASDIRSVDDGWPRVGSKFHHRVGVRPLTIADSTQLLAVEPPRMLRLAVRARPFISAVVTFVVVGDAERCVVSMEEEPAVRAVGNLVRPVMDPVTHLRNHLSLERLEVFLCDRTPSAPLVA